MATSTRPLAPGRFVANTADQNTATGAGALLSNTTGNSNTANGAFALFDNTTGGVNTAVGDRALQSNVSGDGNIALGEGAGFNLTTGDNNIDIGSEGIAGESNTIRVGDSSIHSLVYLAGIVQMTVAAPFEVVIVDPSSGQLGRADVGNFD